jgi:hypothetical protein
MPDAKRHSSGPGRFARAAWDNITRSLHASTTATNTERDLSERDVIIRPAGVRRQILGKRGTF